MVQTKVVTLIHDILMEVTDIITRAPILKGKTIQAIIIHQEAEMQHFTRAVEAKVLHSTKTALESVRHYLRSEAKTHSCCK